MCALEDVIELPKATREQWKQAALGDGAHSVWVAGVRVCTGRDVNACQLHSWVRKGAGVVGALGLKLEASVNHVEGEFAALTAAEDEVRMRLKL